MAKELPQYIYKYTSVNKFLFEILIRSELWFAPPFEFNDPFDSFLPVDFIIETVKRSAGWQNNPSLIEQQQEMIVRPIVFSNKLNELRKVIGVCCFSTVPDNLIMWSHYADKHKGVILKFDVAELKRVFSTIRYVTYSDHVKTVNYEREPDLIIMTKLLTKKSSHWKSESEVRIIVKKKGYYGFPKSALKEIVFGLRCDNNQRSDIIKLMEKFGYQNTSLWHAHTGNYDYKLKKGLITTAKDFTGHKPLGDQGEKMFQFIKNSLGEID